MVVIDISKGIYLKCCPVKMAP